MEYLFSYGSLRDKAIQKAIFDRELKGRPDALHGYELSATKAYGRYPIVVETKDVAKIIEGMAYELEKVELALADGYEGAEYQRILVDLASGRKAWLYVAT